jgi:endonuclease-8
VPEGDAVFRTARRLDAALAGHLLLRAELRWPTVGGIDLTGRTVLGTGTYGKHLLTRFDDGRTLHTHLRMDGSWRAQPPRHGARFGPDVRAVLGSAEWTCVGRRLGMLDVLRTSDEAHLLARLGPDVLAPDWDRQQAVANLLGQGGRGIGETLLDQSVVAGIGTIYMAESLWWHRVWPWATVHEVPDAARVLDTARALMQRSLEARIFTATGDVRRGRETHVHGRTGQPCPRCGEPVRRGEVGAPPTARPAFYCPACQHA